MPLFFIVVLLVYGALNFYILWKVRLAVTPAGGAWQWVAAAFLAVMVLGPMMILLLERWGVIRTAGMLGVVLFCWLAVAFWFVCTGVTLDVWNLAARGAGHVWPVFSGLAATPRIHMAITLGVVALAVALSLREAQDIRLTSVSVPAPQLPAGSKPIRIVQISDLHLGGGTERGRLEKIVAQVREARPDILISTGDLIDAPLEAIEPYAEALRSLEAPMGKFAIPGNHEYYVGIDASRKFHEAAGFRWLRQQAVDVGEYLRIVGCDDPHSLPGVNPPSLDETPLLTADRASVFTLDLRHQPLVMPTAVGKFDLQLSGHTHGGQIFPFSLIVRLRYRYDRGLFDLGDGSKLYVNRGAGTWGPPMRLLSQPEVVVITLEPPQGP